MVVSTSSSDDGTETSRSPHSSRGLRDCKDESHELEASELKDMSSIADIFRAAMFVSYSGKKGKKNVVSSGGTHEREIGRERRCKALNIRSMVRRNVADVRNGC